jgi:hypothetical protein
MNSNDVLILRQWTRKICFFERFCKSFGSSIGRILLRGATVIVALLLFAVNAYALDLSITSSSDPVEDGTTLTITMTVSNPSATTQTNTVLQALTPGYMQLYPGTQAAPAGTCLTGSSFCYQGETMQWSLGNMAPGEIRVVRYSDIVLTSANDGALMTADAMVTADGVSAIQDTHTVVISELTPPLQLALSADRNPAAPGSLVTYRLRYSNPGSTFTANSLSTSLPVGTTFVSATGGGIALGDTVSWPVLVAPGVNGAQEFTVSVGAALTDGTLLRSEAFITDTKCCY